MKEKVPMQYSKYGNLLKSFLHTKIGARIGFYFKIRGLNRVGAVLTRANPKWYQSKHVFLGFSYNSRVNKGADLVASLITGAAQNSIGTPLPPKYIALSTATLTPDKTDTTLASESSASGLARALGTQANYTTPSTLDGSASYTVSKTFTNTSAGPVTVVSAALFDASSSGNLFVEANLSSSAVMAVNDTLAIVWTVNL